MFYKQIFRPHFAVVALIISLPLMSENIYSPSLPSISQYLKVSGSMVEYTMTIYLVGFAMGVFFWGMFSDLIGRRPSLILGLILYLVGALGCLMSDSILSLFIYRFIQAFGGSTGSVLGMSILRDSWSGRCLDAAFSKMSVTLALSLGAGPLVGGTLTHYWGWKSNFQFLVVFGSLTLIVVMLFLPETMSKAYKDKSKERPSFIDTLKEILSDRKVLTFGILVGGCNGILFSYFSEGPFILIKILRVSPDLYGCLTFLVAVPWALGGIISKQLSRTGFDSDQVILFGGILNLIGCFSLCFLSLAGMIKIDYGIFAVFSIVVPLMIALTGVGMMIPNCLSQTLVRYKKRAGLAASVFGLFYYFVIAFLTYIMGTLHNGTVYPMPVFFLLIASAMLGIYWRFLKKRPRNL
jgi:DHA1 family bicyclomycin/chloramphenicol resistance-like MFS transporter